MLEFSDAEIKSKAIALHLIYDSQDLPANLRSRVVAALVEEKRAEAPRDQDQEPRLAKEIVVQPGGAILIDGEPLPWLVAKQAMEIGLNPDGVSTVRLTLMANSVQIIKPEEKKADPS